MGLPPSLVGAVVPELVNQLRRDLPGIRIRVFEGFSEQIERWLAEGDVDVGIYSKYREGESNGGALLDSRLVLAGAAEGWTLPKEIDFRRLAEFPLVLPEATNGLRAIVDGIARRMKVSLNVVADADSILAQKEMAMRCGCYMIKAPLTIASEEGSGVFASSVIRNPFINRYVVVMTGQQKPLSRAGREVASRTTAILRVLSGHR
jgi:DNA-binding transcriptional LysR family regulator